MYKNSIQRTLCGRDFHSRNGHGPWLLAIFPTQRIHKAGLFLWGQAHWSIWCSPQRQSTYRSNFCFHWEEGRYSKRSFPSHYFSTTAEGGLCLHTSFPAQLKHPISVLSHAHIWVASSGMRHSFLSINEGCCPKNNSVVPAALTVSKAFLLSFLKQFAFWWVLPHVQ